MEVKNLILGGELFDAARAAGASVRFTFDGINTDGSEAVFEGPAPDGHYEGSTRVVVELGRLDEFDYYERSLGLILQMFGSGV